MTLEDLKKLVKKRYKIGQVVNCRKCNVTTGVLLKRFKATILEFYPYHVSCLVKGHRESFTYWDMMELTKIGG
jgi:hypothetical protein